MRTASSLFIALVLTGGACAQLRPLTLQDLCTNAERVVIGGVSKLECRWQGPLIVTDVTIAPVECLKGAPSAPFIVTIPGGTIGNVTLHASEAPEFVAGEMCVLFVKTTGTPCGVYGWSKGKYTVLGNQIQELPGVSLGQFRQEILELVHH